MRKPPPLFLLKVFSSQKVEIHVRNVVQRKKVTPQSKACKQREVRPFRNGINGHVYPAQKPHLVVDYDRTATVLRILK